jgi:RNA recognition motif-containing protein
MDLNGMLAAQLLGMKAEKPSTLVWVTGISKECADPDFLCNIFGNYGNVRRIKFSKKKPDGALIEMQDPRDVTKTCRFLNDIKLGGERISVKRTRLTKVFVSQDDENSKDFSKVIKEHWRYNKGSKFTKIIMKRASHPTPLILVSNVPEGKVSELKDYIIESGYTVKGIEEGKPRKEEDKKPTSNKTFVIVELASTEEAVSAVGKLHNTMPSNIGEKADQKFNRGLVFTFATKRESKDAA